MLNDQNAAARPHDANRLRQDDLDKPRVLVDFGGELKRPGGGFDRREVDDASLSLRHDLLRDDKHVASARRNAVALDRRGDEFDQVVARPDQGQAPQPDDLE